MASLKGIEVGVHRKKSVLVHKISITKESLLNVTGRMKSFQELSDFFSLEWSNYPKIHMEE